MTNQKCSQPNCHTVWALATAFDLVAFRLSMIVPAVKKSVNHPRTVASMLETGWEQQQEQVRLRSDSQRFESVR